MTGAGLAVDPLRDVRLVLFDLDGTLVDSVPDLAQAANAMLAELGRPPATEEQVRRWVGDGIGKLVERLLGSAGQDADWLKRAEQLYREAYARHLTDRSHAYPGVPEMLAELRERGLHLACVTNKDTRLARALLAHLGLDRHVGWVIGGDRTRPKPDPDMLEKAMHAFGIPPEGSVLVGDSVADIGAARAAGVPVIAVSWGYNHGRDIAEERPDHVIDHMPELVSLIERAA